MSRKNFPRSFTTLALAVTLAACASASKTKDAPRMEASRGTGKESVLTRDQAMYRSKQLKKITYNLWFNLAETGEEFQGRATIVFDLRDDADRFLPTLRLDFTDGAIQTVRLNNDEWNAKKIASHYDGSRIEFKVSELQKGQNRVEIAYRHPYSKTGNGLYRFVDTTDQQVYFYTHFEPYYANLVFPCFDQPDLKATFETTAEVPTDWEVITNVPEREISKAGGLNSWQFPASPTMSTYLFALHAGPYHEWKADADGIPLRLFARQSEVKNVDAENWFKTTRKGLEFYADYFGMPYPYGKYDQVIVPNLNAGAMENIAAVTFTERYNFKSKPTVDQLKRRSDTILHEMAHMWFGDLVTMRWWNGLWLNESFASYMAFLAMKEVKLFPNIEESFNLDLKSWAYFEDSLVTNHPIETSVVDTATAFSIFDGITYGKGASALQQLHQFIGDEDFREGLHRYFERFANKNTVLADLMQSLAHAADQDLGPWQRAWLTTSGTNRVSAEVLCTDGRIEKLTVKQAAPGEGNVLRPHQIDAALYSIARDGTPVRSADHFALTLLGAETGVEEARGKKCPQLVFLNDGDLGFIRQDFSAAELTALKAGLSKLQPTLNRQMVYATLSDGVRAGTVRPQDYMAIIEAHLPAEKNDELIGRVAGHFVRVAAAYPANERAKLLARFHALAKKEMSRSAAGNDRQVAWWKWATLTVNDRESAAWALAVVDGKTAIRGMSLGSDRKFSLVQAAAEIEPVNAERIADMLRKDPSEEAIVQSMRARVISPDAEAKLDIFRRFTREKTDLPEWNYTARLRRSMRGFIHPANEARTRAWLPVYIQQLPNVVKSTDETYSEEFTTDLYPALCEAEAASQISEAFTKVELPVSVRKSLRQAEQLDRECIRSRGAFVR